jgi:hypothetical protein
VVSYVLMLMLFHGGETIQNENEGRAARLFVFLLDVFSSFALFLIIGSLPPALISAVVGLVT